MLGRQKRQQEGAYKLRIRQPCRVARISFLEGKSVDENGARTPEQDVVGSGVLEAQILPKKPLCDVEGELACGLKHPGGPLVGVAGEWNPLMLDQQLSMKNVKQL